MSDFLRIFAVENGKCATIQNKLKKNCIFLEIYLVISEKSRNFALSKRKKYYKLNH